MDNEPNRRLDEYEIVLGLLLPLLLVILIIVNLVTGKAWVPELLDDFNPRLFNTFTRPLTVFGIILIKAGLSAGFFVWFWVANRKRFDQHIILLQTISIGIAALGVILLIVSFCI